MRLVKKTLMAAIAITCALSMGGCRKKKSDMLPNENRGTDYKYDFKDYIDINVYGTDGNGFVQITPKDISADDFESDDEYIAVRADIDAINPTIIPGSSNNTESSSGMKVSKVDGLHNGDMITITPTVKKEDMLTDINIEPYDFVVSDLKDAAQIDLFSPDVVTVFATSDNMLHYYIHANPSYPEDMLANLVYTLKTGDTKIEAKKTVVHAAVDMDETFLTESGNYTLDIYLAKHGYAAEKEHDMVLSEVVEPVSFSSGNQDAVGQAVFAALAVDEPALVSLGNIQQTMRQENESPYAYVVTYYNRENDEIKAYRRELTIYPVAGTYMVTGFGMRSQTDSRYLTESYDDSKILATYAMEGDQNLATPEPTPEATPEITPAPEGTQDVPAEAPAEQPVEEAPAEQQYDENGNPISAVPAVGSIA